jgi:hypothetical protein
MSDSVSRPLRAYEGKVIELLTRGVLPPETLQSVKEDAEFVGYEHTGVGYFLTLKHAKLPKERVVCHKPLVTGESKGVLSGFIVFLEDNELTLECYSLSEADVPQSYRDEDVRVQVCDLTL